MDLLTLTQSWSGLTIMVPPVYLTTGWTFLASWLSVQGQWRGLEVQNSSRFGQELYTGAGVMITGNDTLSPCPSPIKLLQTKCICSAHKIGFTTRYIANQLCQHYNMGYWHHHRKWWWSFFLWGLGLLLTNSYVMYTRVMDDHNIPKKQCYTHYEFLLSIAKAWLDKEEIQPRKIQLHGNRFMKKQEDKNSGGVAAAKSPERSLWVPFSPLCKSPRQSAVCTNTSPTSSITTPSAARWSGASFDGSNNTNTPGSSLSSLALSPKNAPRINDNTLNPDHGALRAWPFSRSYRNWSTVCPTWIP